MCYKGFHPADSTSKRAMQMRICMNYAPGKVIYIIEERGGRGLGIAGVWGVGGGFSIKYGHEATLSVLNN